jgi:hypothetical protein
MPGVIVALSFEKIIVVQPVPAPLTFNNNALQGSSFTGCAVNPGEKNSMHKRKSSKHIGRRPLCKGLELIACGFIRLTQTNYNNSNRKSLVVLSLDPTINIMKSLSLKVLTLQKIK